MKSEALQSAVYVQCRTVDRAIGEEISVEFNLNGRDLIR